MSSTPKPPVYPIEHLEDFTRLEWCNRLLSDPAITKIMKRTPPLPTNGEGKFNRFFTTTLFTDDAIRAFLSMYRPGRGRAQNMDDAEIAGDALLGSNGNGSGAKQIREGANGEGENDGDEHTHPASRPHGPFSPHDGPEALLLVSLAKGLDGGIDRLHGGVTATLLDHVMGMLVSCALRSNSVTKELTVRYKKPVKTPIVLLCRARVLRVKGRWVELEGWIEDGEGTVYAESWGGFVRSRVGDGIGAPSGKLVTKGGFRERAKI